MPPIFRRWNKATYRLVTHPPVFWLRTRLRPSTCSYTTLHHVYYQPMWAISYLKHRFIFSLWQLEGKESCWPISRQHGDVMPSSSRAHGKKCHHRKSIYINALHTASCTYWNQPLDKAVVLCLWMAHKLTITTGKGWNGSLPLQPSEGDVHTPAQTQSLPGARSYTITSHSALVRPYHPLEGKTITRRLITSKKVN